MKCYDGWYLFSDIDGTLMTDEVPQQNIDALFRFTQGGGKFSLVTGRGLILTRPLAERLYVNFPCILYNGGLIYDYKREEALAVSYLPSGVESLSQAVLSAWPGSYGTLWGYARRYDVGPWPDADARDSMIRFLDEINEPLTKMVFCVDANRRLEIMEWIDSMEIQGIDVTSSCDYFVEIVPHGVSKGRGLAQLLRYFGIRPEQAAVAGDYLNDLSMLRLPGVRAFCPQNAHPDIKQICEATLCHVANGMLAELIDSL